MIYIEYIIPLILTLFFSISVFFSRKIIFFIIGFVSIIQPLILSLRTEDYNSDTFNYSKYFDLLKNTNGLEVFLVTKFEPLHLLLAYISEDFRLWLIFESILCSALIISIIRRIRRLESIAIILGSAVPLFSSSMRFSIGLLSVAYAAMIFEKIKGNIFIVSIIGGMFHLSLVTSGFLQKLKLVPILILMLFIVGYVLNDVEILERAGVSENNVSGGSGLRSFLTLLVLLLIIFINRFKYSFNSFINDILIALLLLVATNYFFPVFNRFIVIFLIVKAVQFDSQVFVPVRSKYPIEGLSAALLYVMLVIPFLLSVKNKMSLDEW